MYSNCKMRGYQMNAHPSLGGFPQVFRLNITQSRLWSLMSHSISVCDSAGDNRVQVSEMGCRACTDKHLNRSTHLFSNLSSTHSLQSLTCQTDLRNTNVVTELKNSLLCFIMQHLLLHNQVFDKRHFQLLLSLTVQVSKP